jgi:hypothetical protein
VLVAALVLASPTPTGAQQPAPAAASGSSEEAKARAYPIFNEGLRLVEDMNWSEALDKFSQAWRIYPSPVVLFNIAYCQRALGQYVRSLETFRQFLGMELEGAAASRKQEAEQYVRELQARVARLQLSIPEDIRSGCEVVVDGRVRTVNAKGEVDLTIDPGHHTIQVRREGYRPLLEDREVRPGSQLRVVARLEQLPAWLVVSSNTSGARVLVDGIPRGIVPFAAEVPPGRHQLEVTAEGFVTHRSTLSLQPGGTAKVRGDLLPEPVPITKRWWFWTGIGLVVTGAAVTTYALTRPQPGPPPYETGSLGWVVAP